jgi:hypothetical protein
MYGLEPNTDWSVGFAFGAAGGVTTAGGVGCPKSDLKSAAGSESVFVDPDTVPFWFGDVAVPVASVLVSLDALGAILPVITL